MTEASISPAVELLLEDMPKAELHLHLDGSLRVDTALDLARSRGIDAPRTREEMGAALVAPMPCIDQAELLRAFELPIALMQDAEALDRVTAELVETKAAEKVEYVEIRWGPLLHMARGLPLADGIAAVCRGARRGAAATGIEVRLICTAIRSHDPTNNVDLAEAAARFRDQGVVGWDLAGPEATNPNPMVHGRAFEAARAAGLRITLHAAEWGGPAQIRRSLPLGPERIAHGAAAIEDPALCEELIARGITLDLCPTSNVQAGVVRSLEEHPIARLHRAGVSVTLSTDDTTVSDLTLTEEYTRALTRIGVTLPELWAMNRRALDVAFADEETLVPLRRRFDVWGAGVPEIQAPRQG
jgi:adenosine deaminase